MPFYRKFRMPPKGYKTITVKEEYAPYVKRYYEKLLASGPPSADEWLEQEGEFLKITLRIPVKEYSSIVSGLTRFFGRRIDWIDPHGLLASYIDVCKMLMDCTALQVAGDAGMIRDFRDIFEEILPDIDKIVRDEDKFMREGSFWRIDQLYTKPFAVLVRIAEVQERAGSNKLSVKFLSDNFQLKRSTLLLILTLLKKLGFVIIEVVDMYREGDIFVTLTDLGKKAAMFLKDMYLWFRSRLIDQKKVLESFIGIDFKYLGSGFYAGVVTVGSEDIWYYLTKEQRRELESLVVQTVSGRLYSREALKKLADMGIMTPYLEHLLKKFGAFIASIKDLSEQV